MVVTTTAVLTGCGGDGSTSGASDEDQQALEKVTSEIQQAARSHDAEAFCDLLQPSLMDAAFGGPKACVKASRTAMGSTSPLADLEITRVVTDGEGAIVTYSKDPPGEVLFVRENDNWYIALDELARARTEARRKGQQIRNQNQGGGNIRPDSSTQPDQSG